MVIDSDLPLWMMIEYKITTKTIDDSRSLVGSRYLHNTVRVDVKSDFNLRNALGR